MIVSSHPQQVFHSLRLFSSHRGEASDLRLLAGYALFIVASKGGEVGDFSFPGPRLCVYWVVGMRCPSIEEPIASVRPLIESIHNSILLDGGVIEDHWKMTEALCSLTITAFYIGVDKEGSGVGWNIHPSIWIATCHWVRW